MSCETFVYDGLGFSVKNVTEQTALAFLKGHIETVKELDSDIAEQVTDDDLDIDYDAEKGYSSTGYLNLITDVIRAESKIPIGIQEGDEDIAIMYEPSYPWEMSEEEKSLTSEEMVEKLALYSQELNCYRPDYISVETWG